MPCTSAAIRSADSLSPRSAASIALPTVAVIAHKLLARLGREPARLLQIRQDLIPAADPHLAPGTGREGPGQEPQPALARYAAAAVARHELDDREVSEHQCGAAQEAHLRRVHAVRGPVRESSQHFGAVRDGLGVRQDREPARIIRSDPGPVERGDDRSSGRVRRATPEAPGRRPPQQVDGDVAPAGVERPVRCLDQRSKTPAVQEIAERDDLADGNQASPLDRAQLGKVGQAHEVRDDAPLAELTGQLSRPEEQRTTPRRDLP